MINFMLPGLNEQSELNFKFLNLKLQHPEYFNDNININAVYGNFQFCIWDGGRIFTSYRQNTKEEIETIVNTYNKKYNTPVRFVFTNNQLTKKDCYDRFCNIILELSENNINEVVVNSPILQEYIEKTYPKYKFISSTTKCLTNPEDSLKEIMNEKYFLTCLDYNLNKNKSYLDSIPLEYRSKVEILINAICPPGCPNRKEHYKLNSLFSLSYGKRYKVNNCQIKENTLFPNLNKANNLTPDEIYNEYYPKGFQYFKIEGRTLSTVENALNYVKYMIKPEYQFYVIQLLLSK